MALSPDGRYAYALGNLATWPAAKRAQRRKSSLSIDSSGDQPGVA